MKNLLTAVSTTTVLLTACAPQAERPQITHTEISASEAQAQAEAAEIYGQTVDFINQAEFSAPADQPDDQPATVQYQSNGRNITAVYAQQGDTALVKLRGPNLHVVLPQTEIRHNGATYSNGKHTWHTREQHADWTHNQQTLIFTALH